MFEYHSEQLHIENNKAKIKKVDIQGKKGTKQIIEKSLKGRTLRKSKKPLKPSEIKCIQKCQFIPGLFKDCEDCIKNISLKTRRNRRTHH